jgi:RIO kinase 1
MLVPDRLNTLLDEGFIQAVLRPLKSGKEAAVFVVEMDGVLRAAKVYKEMKLRNFRNRHDYLDGRQSGDSREQRAMDRGSKYGKQQREEAWQSAEAKALDTLHAAGVRIPRVHQHLDGVIIMDLVVDARGEPAPQLAMCNFSRDEALRHHATLMKQIQRMLCAGLVHGDLSEYNVLLAGDGPVIIDLPQAIDATKNNNAKRILIRDVGNLTRFFSRFAPELRRTDYAQELWLLLENAALTPDTPLTGRFQAARQVVDTAIVLREIAAAKEEAAKRAEVKAWREAEATRKAQNAQSGSGAPRRR